MSLTVFVPSAFYEVREAYHNLFVEGIPHPDRVMEEHDLVYLVDGEWEVFEEGTPYLLHVLSDNGYTDLAYTLLLQEEFPSWLFSVKMGATTIWEHWDGMRPDGTMWSTDMNSFNHYAYGAVADWLYGVVGGIQPSEEQPGFARFTLAPQADHRLGSANVSLETAYGTIRSSWRYQHGEVVYEFTVPNGCVADICIGRDCQTVTGGTYTFRK